LPKFVDISYIPPELQGKGEFEYYHPPISTQPIDKTARATIVDQQLETLNKFLEITRRWAETPSEITICEERDNLKFQLQQLYREAENLRPRHMYHTLGVLAPDDTYVWKINKK